MQKRRGCPIIGKNCNEGVTQDMRVAPFLLYRKTDKEDWVMRYHNVTNTMSTVPVYQETGMKYELNNKIIKMKEEIHKICVSIDEAQDRIDFINRRISSKVPISDDRKMELENEAKALNSYIASLNRTRSNLENELALVKEDLEYIK